MNWELLRAHGVHVEPSGAGWAVSYADEHGRRYNPGIIHDGMFWPMGQFPWASALRQTVNDLARIMEPVRCVTVRNLAGCTEQQVFDYVALRLLMQGEKSRSEDGECALRGVRNGLKCAIGWLIPDELYRPSMEWEGPTDIVAKRWTDAHDRLLANLQSVHDDDPAELWGDGLNNVAGDRGLEPFPREEVTHEP